MVGQDPKQFIQAYLSLPAGSPEPAPPPPNNSWLRGKPGQTWRGAGMEAITASVKFLKQRSLPHYQIHAVAFEDKAGQAWNYVCLIAQDEQGFWHMLAEAGINKNNVSKPTSTFPWIHLVGAVGQNHLWVGGYVTSKATHTQLVRLISRNQLVLNDTVEDGVVLFLTDQQVEKPIQVELYTQADELIGTQTAFDYTI